MSRLALVALGFRGCSVGDTLPEQWYNDETEQCACDACNR